MGALTHTSCHTPSNPTTAYLTGLPLFLVLFVVASSHLYFLYVLYEASFDLSEKVEDYVDLWIPVFFLSIIVEWVYSEVNGLNLVRLNDLSSSLGLGSYMTLSRKIIGVYYTFHPYNHIYTHYRLTDIFTGPLTFFAMFFIVEFIYYWIHRTGHTLHFGWAMHGVHHSSEDYNLSTALRQSTLHGIISQLYYLPAALFFHPTHYILHAQFNLLYQFWIHTSTIPKLGWVEYIFNTPSQHRVHHGRNPYCIDKNYGGTLCVFDRLFGTFEEEKEEEPVVYGTTHGLESFDPVWANYELWKPMFTFSETKSIKDWVLRFYYGPGWIPGTHPPQEYSVPPITRERQQKFDPALPYGLQVYAFINVIMCSGATGVILNTKNLPIPFIAENNVLFWTFGLYYLYSLSLVFNRSKYAPLFELVKYTLTALIFYVYAMQSQDMCVFYCAGSVCALFSIWILCYYSAFQIPLDHTEISKDLPAANEGKKVK